MVVATRHAVVMSPPSLLERTDADFIHHVLSEVTASGLPKRGDDRLAHTRDSTNILKLQQPVHRTFYVAVFDIACDVFGSPRLDPRRIDSAGLVVRRVAAESREGWRQGGKSLKGWIGFNSSRDADLDPDATRQPSHLSAGHPEIDSRLTAVFGT